MCPPLPLNPDGTLNASAAAAYRPAQHAVQCQTLRLPIPQQPESSSSATRIMATSASRPYDERSHSSSSSYSSSALSSHPSGGGGGPSSPRERGLAGVSRRPFRLPSNYVSASLPEAPKRINNSNSNNVGRIISRGCASGDISELYRQCLHREVATAGGVSCRSVVMEYLECTAGERDDRRS